MIDDSEVKAIWEETDAKLDNLINVEWPKCLEINDRPEKQGYSIFLNFFFAHIYWMDSQILSIHIYLVGILCILFTYAKENLFNIAISDFKFLHSNNNIVSIRKDVSISNVLQQLISYSSTIQSLTVSF